MTDTNQNYIPTVGVIVFNQNKVLLVRHKPAADHLTDTYGLPAGRLDEDESGKDAAVRELREETGFKTLPENLVELPNLYYAAIERKDGSKRSYSWRVYKCNNYSGEIKGDNETIPEWIKISDLKNYQLLPNVGNAIDDALKLR